MYLQCIVIRNLLWNNIAIKEIGTVPIPYVPKMEPVQIR